MSEEILRLKLDEVKEIIKQGAMELVNPLVTPIEKAREIFGEDFLGPEAIRDAFDITLPPEKIPEIHFNLEELRRAKDLGQFLILRVSRAFDGQPLTIQKMEQPLEDLFNRERRGDVFDDWFWSDYNKSKKLFSMHTSKPGWALVSKEVVPESTNKNYLDQTEALADYLQYFVYRGIAMPTKYKEAIDEFNSIKEERGGQKNDIIWAKTLLELKLNRLTRQTPVEVVYDIGVYFSKKSRVLLENMSTWTISLDHLDYISILGVGDSTSRGITMTSRMPMASFNWLGVFFSRYSL